MSLFCNSCDKVKGLKAGIWVTLGVIFTLGIFAIFMPKQRKSVIEKIKSKLNK